MASDEQKQKQQQQQQQIQQQVSSMNKSAMAAAAAPAVEEASLHSAVTEHTGDNNGDFLHANRSSNEDSAACSSVANSCSNSGNMNKNSNILEHDYIGLNGDSPSLSVDKPEGEDSCAILPDLNLGLRLGPPKNKSELLEDKERSLAARLKLPGAGSKRAYAEAVGIPDLVKNLPSKNQFMSQMFPWSNNSSKQWRPNVAIEQRSFNPFQSKQQQQQVAAAAAAAASPMSCLNPGDETPSSSGPVVGWPPVQSFRKNTLVTSPQAAKSPVDREALAPQAEGQTGSSLFVKVYMDGVPIGRKVDLEANNSYPKLSSALKDMFSGFINGQNLPKLRPNLPSGEAQQQINLFDGHEAEYVLTYEDKDGDLMLVGDVPWRMFAATVKRLRIMKGSDAIGLSVPKDSEDQAARIVKTRS